tara:strand:+ start:305 stop:412 length:108 start_codon:yes stop_codon:yes gene_type:complete
LEACEAYSETLDFVDEHTDEGVVILENLLLGIGPQ